MNRIGALMVAALVWAAAECQAKAADIKVLSAVALESALNELLPQFERSSGQKATGSYATAGVVTERIQKGEPTDVAIATGAQMEDLQRSGKIVDGSRLGIAKVALGIFVRKGALKPDISSVDAFKRALLAAKSIAYADPAGGGVSGIQLARLVERLGMVDQMRPKTKLGSPAAPLFQLIVKGDADFGFNQISEILAAPDVELVGPLPAEIQSYTSFAAGIVTTSNQQGAAKAFIDFTVSPAAQAVIKSKGFEKY
jgi:molybdate transport system substrate-binding protein